LEAAVTERERQRFVDQVWREKEEEHGFPCPALLRRLVKPRDYLTGHHDEDTERQDFRDGVDDCIEQQLPVIFHFAAGFASAFVGEAEDEAEGQQSGKRVYQKCFERRLRIFGFVAERALPPLGVLRGDFRIAPKRMPWRELSAAWNRAFPHDPMTPELLRVAYWRAKQAGLGEVYRRRQLQGLADMLASLPAFIRDLSIIDQVRHSRTGLSLGEIRREVERLKLAARAEQRSIAPTRMAKSRS
jgi:hypothetical protein